VQLANVTLHEIPIFEFKFTTENRKQTHSQSIILDELHLRSLLTRAGWCTSWWNVDSYHSSRACWVVQRKFVSIYLLHYQTSQA